MEVEKGAWFQVGIYASNDTAEEKTVHVTVKDVKVRIAANKDTTAEYAMDIQSSYHTIFDETNPIEYNVLSEVVRRVGLENAYSWNNTVDFKENAEVLIKMVTVQPGSHKINMLKFF